MGADETVSTTLEIPQDPSTLSEEPAFPSEPAHAPHRKKRPRRPFSNPSRLKLKVLIPPYRRGQRTKRAKPSSD